MVIILVKENRFTQLTISSDGGRGNLIFFCFSFDKYTATFL